MDDNKEKPTNSEFEALKKAEADGLRGPQTGLEGDPRMEAKTYEPLNPFRPRYRKLSDVEAEHHDAIKNKAMDLLETIRETPGIRTKAGQANDGEVFACLKLSERHLEDAVYRAVKALTA